MQPARLERLWMGGETGGEMGKKKDRAVHGVWVLMREVRCTVKKQVYEHR